jgi:serpin B
MSSINGWVSEKTNNRIPTLLNSIDPDEVMFLVNTLYIKVDWEKGFVEESTGDRVFTLLNGQVIQTPTMYADRGFNTYSDDDMIAVELPYKDEGLSI